MSRLLVPFVLLLVVPLAAGHGAPPPRAQDTYLLDDHNDDCGGHMATDPDRCNGTHDLVALHVQEAHDPVLGDVVKFRFFLNKGQAADGLRDVLTLKANGATKTFELRTTNNADFQGTGFDHVAKAIPVRFPSGSTDGDRFLVEATVKSTALGGIGAKLTDYKLEAFRGSNNARGDYMPGGAYNGIIDNANPDQGDEATNRVRTSGYVLTGPTYYAKTTPPSNVQLTTGGTKEVQVALGNLLRSADWPTNQIATLSVTSPNGLAASFDGAASTAVDLPATGTVNVPLQIASQGGPLTGQLTLTVTTNLGGRTIHTVPVTVEAAPQSSTSSTSTPLDSEGAPAPGFIMLLGVIALAVALRRRT